MDSRVWVRLKMMIEAEVKRQLESMKNGIAEKMSEEFNAEKAKQWQINGRKKAIEEELEDILEMLKEQAREGKNGIVRASLYEDTKVELRRRRFIVDLTAIGDYRIYW